MGPRFRVSSERLEKPGIEPWTPGLEGEQLNHYATEASNFILLERNKNTETNVCVHLKPLYVLYINLEMSSTMNFFLLICEIHGF